MGYENGKIYKITGSGLTYYGSTIQLLNDRLAQHKHKQLCSSKQIFDLGEYKIELVENYSCENKKQLLWRERWYIDNNDCINKLNPIISEEEIIENDKIRKYNYYHNNIDINIDRQRKYNLINKEKINEKMREYRLLNKDKINERRRELKKLKKQCII